MSDRDDGRSIIPTTASDSHQCHARPWAVILPAESLLEVLHESLSLSAGRYGSRCAALVGVFRRPESGGTYTRQLHFFVITEHQLQRPGGGRAGNIPWRDSDRSDHAGRSRTATLIGRC